MAGVARGRKPSATNAETRKVIQEAADDGVLPLKVMLDNLRFYTKKADELIALLIEQGVGAMPDDEASEDGAPPGILEAIGQVVGLRKLAGEEAARAAPYCHPRQGNALDEDSGEQEVPLHARLAAYQRRDDIAASEGKVVELKAGK